MQKEELFEKSYQAVGYERDLIHKVFESGEKQRTAECVKAMEASHDAFTEVCEAGLLDEYMDWGYEKVSK